MPIDDPTTSPVFYKPERFPRRNLIGQRFGRLVVLSFVEYRKKSYAYWYCCCDCGSYCTIAGNSLIRQRTQSCGCYQKEQTSKSRRRHGQSKTSLHTRWNSMLQRCTNPRNINYKHYGGRGIYICSQWYAFDNFAADMGEPLPETTLERRDNNGPYSKENCYWGTKEEQNNNKRTNCSITFQGKTQTLTQWAREQGMHKNTLRERLKHGWSIEDALTEPARRHNDGLVTLARIQGIFIDTVRERIAQGWSKEQALTTPVRKRRNPKIQDNEHNA